MIGALIGDIVGSRFEFNNHRSKAFQLFTDNCQATDDSIMTLAVAKAMMQTFEDEKERNKEKGQNTERVDDLYQRLSEQTIFYMRDIGRPYPDCGYGGRFGQWIYSDTMGPYHSFGNGAAMRVSPVAFAGQTLHQVKLLSNSVTRVTHNHPEGLKGAEATAVAIFMAKNGASKAEIRQEVENAYYPLNFTIDEIRSTYQFNETCQDTVPQAIQAFLESEDFEDAIRTAISVGGDSDTLAAITGAIAQAYYGVPKPMVEKALSYLDPNLKQIYEDWINFQF